MNFIQRLALGAALFFLPLKQVQAQSVEIGASKHATQLIAKHTIPITNTFRVQGFHRTIEYKKEGTIDANLTLITGTYDVLNGHLKPAIQFYKFRDQRSRVQFGAILTTKNIGNNLTFNITGQAYQAGDDEILLLGAGHLQYTIENLQIELGATTAHRTQELQPGQENYFPEGPKKLLDLYSQITLKLEQLTVAAGIKRTTFTPGMQAYAFTAPYLQIQRN